MFETARRWVPTAAGASLGALVALAAPRGPVTATGALLLLVAALAGGVVSGVVSRSRWAIVAAPVAYVVAFEVLGDHAGITAGPLDDGSAWGFAAAISGRLVHGSIALLPLMLGATLGAAWSRRTAEPPTGVAPRALRWLRRGVTAVAAVAVMVLGSELTKPASTPAVQGARPVAELRSFTHDGATLWMSVRGADRRAPVVLYLPGGPGQSDLGLGRAVLEPLTKEFTVAILDGRGVGKAYPSFDPDAMRTEQLVDDVVAAADDLRRRFGQRRIFLLGESAGTIVGVLAVQRAPDRFAAWLGSGQMVAPLETDRSIRRDLARVLRARGATGDLATLERLGTPPYAHPASYAWVAARYDRIGGDYIAPADYEGRVERAGVGPLGLGAPEYTLLDRVGAVRGLMDTFAVVYPRWQRIDLRRSVRRLRVPVHLFIGEHELPGRRAPAEEWFRQVSAPWKQWHEARGGGHAAAFERIDLLQRALRDEAARAKPTGPPVR